MKSGQIPSGNRQQTGSGRRVDRRSLAPFCREKAHDCFRLAEAGPAGDLRDNWIMLSNGWTQLAVHSEK
jgi:hypothetical protein